MEVYGDNLHQNDGKHLDRGVADDTIWKQCWRRLVYHAAGGRLQEVHRVPGGRMARCLQLEMELQETPCLCARHFDTKDRHAPGQGDPGEDIQANRPVVVR